MFVPIAVLTKSGQVPVNAVKQSSPRAATSNSTTRPVNTAAPKSKVNDALPTTYSYFKAHSPVRSLLDEVKSCLKFPRTEHMYKSDLKNVVFPSKRFSWVLFLATKDETSEILKNFITGIENQINHKVKIIRCDNGTEFKNNDMNQFCGIKGIKREFSVARTPQQNRVAERKNRTLIEAARTKLVDSLLPTTFWTEAVSTACYVQNMILVTKPHNKTPYELLHGDHLSLKDVVADDAGKKTNEEPANKGERNG
ncbi:putative ribonuclease H-like domain-containing protein [Tanacetum coccineum]